MAPWPTTSPAISVRYWKTDFSRHTVPFDELVVGTLFRDSIRPVDRPKFTTVEGASEWLDDREPVIAFDLDGDARAYPLQILMFHEIVNDVVADVPVVITYCPLCNSAVVFDRRLDGVTYDFGTSGYLRKSDLVMWDRQTESWWQQITGEAIVGELAGNRLTFLPTTIVSYTDFRAEYPEGEVLSNSMGFPYPYGRNLYEHYDEPTRLPHMSRFALTGGPPPKTRVVGLDIDGVRAAVPYPLLEREGALNAIVGDRELVVLFQTGTLSALDQLSIKRSRDVGSTGVFDPHVDGRTLWFKAEGGQIVDDQTGSSWSILGRAVSGPLAGHKLEPIVHGDHFWFAWVSLYPDTLLFSDTRAEEP